MSDKRFTKGDAVFIAALVMVLVIGAGIAVLALSHH